MCRRGRHHDNLPELLVLFVQVTSVIISSYSRDPRSGLPAMQHHGLILENCFEISIGGCTVGHFQFCTLHVLRCSERTDQAKLDIFFTTKKKSAIQRLQAIMGSATTVHEETLVKRSCAHLSFLASQLDQLLRPFQG